MKSKKGITLIALIITIIVMMILVGVTVTVAINGGLFDKTKLAAYKHEKAMLDEEIIIKTEEMNIEISSNGEKYDNLDIDETFIELYYLITEKGFEIDSRYVVPIKDDRYMINYLNLLEDGYLDAENYSATIPCKYKGEDLKLILEFGGEIKIRANTSTIIKVETETEPVTVTVGENIASVTEDGVPIPKGFYYVTGTKNTGVVISDNELDKNNPTGNEGNQFVWVPVNVNPKLKIEVEAEKLIESIRILSVTGYDETIGVNKYYFKKTINLTDNDAYEVIVKYEDGTEESILREVNIVYATIDEAYGFVKQYAGLAGKSIDETIQLLKTSFLENDPTLELNTRIDVMRYFMTEEADLIKEHHVDDVSEAPNVLKYGGFYIGRYEASLTQGIKKSVTPTRSISYADAKTAISNMYANVDKYGVTADLPSGAAWDWLGNWLISTKAKTSYEIYIDSVEWGNFRVLLNNKNYSLKSTGSDSDYRANNIYDLVGNLKEWTKEVEKKKVKDSTTGEESVEVVGNVARGGGYNGVRWTTFSKKDAYSDTDTTVGVRPMLYIND